MTVFDPLLGGPLDHEHDILLIAGSRPEVARLAPVASAVAAADRFRAITVATGADPMSVHEAFDAFGVPTDITLLLPSDTATGLADVAAALLTRLDRLMVDQDPSAVLVHGGGVAASIAATVAFWRRIPVVHMQAGMGTDDLLCPFPQEAHRRVIGQLASLFLTTSGSALGSPLGPNVLTIGDTVHALPGPADVRCADVLGRVRDERERLVLVNLDRPSSHDALAGLPACSSGSTTSRSCSSGTSRPGSSGSTSGVTRGSSSRPRRSSRTCSSCSPRRRADLRRRGPRRGRPRPRYGGGPGGRPERAPSRATRSGPSAARPFSPT